MKPTGIMPSKSQKMRQEKQKKREERKRKVKVKTSVSLLNPPQKILLSAHAPTSQANMDQRVAKCTTCKQEALW